MTWVLRPGVGRKYSIRRSGGTLFVRRRRSHSHRKAVSMMQTAEDWDSIDSGSLWRPRRGQVSGAVGRLHSEAAMGPAMVVGKVVVENALGMFLVFDDDMVETIPAEGARCRGSLGNPLFTSTDRRLSFRRHGAF